MSASSKGRPSPNATSPDAAPKAMLCSPASAKPKSAVNGITRHIAHERDWIAIAVEPDLCKLGSDLIAFSSYATLDFAETASPNVKARGRPVLRQGDMVRGVHSNGGKHVVSSTALETGYLLISDGHSNCKINGIPVARHDSRCRINTDARGAGGALARLYTAMRTVSCTARGSVRISPSGEATNDRLEILEALKNEITLEQLNLDAMDEYVDFERIHTLIENHMKGVVGEPGTALDHVAQTDRALVGALKDNILGISEIFYEGIKSVPKVLRGGLTESGQALNVLDELIMLENIRLGNFAAAPILEDAKILGNALVEPIASAWENEQYVESVIRGLLDFGPVGIAARLLKVRRAKKALEAKKAAEAKKAIEAEKKRAADEAKAKAEKKKNVHDGINIRAGAKITRYKSIPFREGIRAHLKGPHDYTQADGITGTHNRNEFLRVADAHGVQYVETPTSVPGLTHIEYRIPAEEPSKAIKFDSAGNVVYKSMSLEKTVYDPTILSDDKMFRLGREAAVDGYQEALAKGDGAYSAKSGDIWFRVYIDRATGEITSFHPKGK